MILRQGGVCEKMQVTSIPSTHPCEVSVDSNFINSPLMKSFNRHQLCHLTARGVRGSAISGLIERPDMSGL